MSIRKQRVADLLLSFLASELQKFHDANLTFVTLTGIEITQDLKIAKIFWTTPANNTDNNQINPSAFPQQKQIDQVQNSLEAVTNELKRAVGKQLQLKHTPQLKFFFDNSLEQGTRIEALLKEAGY